MKCPYCGHENPPGEEVCEECQHDLAHFSLPRPKGDVSASIMFDRVSALETHDADSVPLSASVAEAVRRMNEIGVGGLVVLDDDGQLVGIVTERDILYKVPAGAEISRIDVASIMTPRPETIALDAPIAFCLHQMAVGGFRHIPAVRKDGRPAKIVSVRDVLKYFAERLEASA